MMGLTFHLQSFMDQIAKPLDSGQKTISPLILAILSQNRGPTIKNRSRFSLFSCSICKTQSERKYIVRLNLKANKNMVDPIYDLEYAERRYQLSYQTPCPTKNKSSDFVGLSSFLRLKNEMKFFILAQP